MPFPSLATLTKRSDLLRQLREFFYERAFIEVQTPLLADEVIPELHIEPFRVESGGFLQASPELYMKQLLVAGAKAIFQVTRSFRQGERGQLHNPEFTLVEWYRVGDDMDGGIELLDELTRTLLGTPPAKRTSYATAFQEHVGLCPHTATLDQLNAAASAAPQGINSANRDEWLNLLLATRIEPQMGRDRPEILFHYPASQAALAKTTIGPTAYEVAERFELYYHGIELANGYHELADAGELRARFEAVNAARAADGRRALPLPERWLAAMNQGLPACTGVALGFDRLFMLAIGAKSIDEVMAISPRPDSCE
ncbi:MAG TPA: EF-P lysine aminoacylase EpmA [Lacipirellulaceae bacterium]|jgi:lysyl-tRNA synthetase class 2